MCGISGAINFQGLDFANKEIVAKINNAMCHRGPDADGIFSDEFVSLGHRRLSIIGLNVQSNQPMKSIDEEIIIVFNGEIYNHDEIRKELESEFKFQTLNSDTEVIINAYKKWGISCLDKFVGMFAFCLYDKKAKKTFLVRDRLGKKPLFYTTINNTIYFASESQAFFAANLLDKKVNSEAVYHYLSFLTVPAPMSFFKNINKVKAGYYHEITDDGMKENQYWDIAYYLNKKIDHSFDKALKETDILLEKAMKYRNVADVPISVALSGGLDSSLNLFYTKKNRSDEICSINVAYETDSRGNESIAAKNFSEELGVKFIGKVLTKEEFIEWINGYLNVSKDSPAGDPNTALMYGISQIAQKNKYKVLLVGEGGDEVGGYPVYSQLSMLNIIFKFLPRTFIRILKYIPRNSLTRKIHRAIDSPLYAARFVFGFPENEKKLFWLKEDNYNSYEIIKKLSDEVDTSFEDNFLRKLQNVEYKLRLAELLLPRVDYPTMAASIEARSPFMDHKLIEYSASLPWKIKMKNGTKTILKNISKSKLPLSIVEGEKVGFGELLVPFMDDILPIWYKRDLIDSTNVPLSKYVNQKFIIDLYKKKLFGYDCGFQLWTFYSLNLWLKNNN